MGHSFLYARLGSDLGIINLADCERYVAELPEEANYCPSCGPPNQQRGVIGLS